jgi:hypothetical protein
MKHHGDDGPSYVYASVLLLLLAGIVLVSLVLTWMLT